MHIFTMKHTKITSYYLSTLFLLLFQSQGNHTTRKIWKKYNEKIMLINLRYESCKANYIHPPFIKDLTCLKSRVEYEKFMKKTISSYSKIPLKWSSCFLNLKSIIYYWENTLQYTHLSDVYCKFPLMYILLYKFQK